MKHKEDNEQEVSFDEFVSMIDVNLKRIKDSILDSIISFNLLNIDLDEINITDELFGDKEYELFCEEVILEFDKEIRECELSKFKMNERKIPYWSFESLFNKN